jgi:hypothetical protein
VDCLMNEWSASIDSIFFFNAFFISYINMQVFINNKAHHATICILITFYSNSENGKTVNKYQSCIKKPNILFLTQSSYWLSAFWNYYQMIWRQNSQSLEVNGSHMNRLFSQMSVMMILLINLGGWGQWVLDYYSYMLTNQQNSEVNNLKMWYKKMGIFNEELQQG